MKKEKIFCSATFDGFSGEITESINMVVTNRGHLEKRQGFRTFIEMIYVLWKINKQNKKMGFSGSYLVELPLNLFIKSKKS